jgi:hypothetical protein
MTEGLQLGIEDRGNDAAIDTTRANEDGGVSIGVREKVGLFFLEDREMRRWKERRRQRANREPAERETSGAKDKAEGGHAARCI